MKHPDYNDRFDPNSHINIITSILVLLFHILTFHYLTDKLNSKVYFLIFFIISDI